MTLSDLSGRLDTVETNISYLLVQLATRPDLVTFSDFVRGQNQDLDALSDNYTLIKSQLQSISSLYANLLNSVNTNYTRLTGHTGDSDVHFSPSIQTTVTGDTTLLYNQRVVFIDNTGSAVAVTLPSVTVSSGEFFHFKKIDASGLVCTITGNVLIDGDTTYLLTGQYESVVIYSNGVSWNTF